MDKFLAVLDRNLPKDKSVSDLFHFYTAIDFANEKKYCVIDDYVFSYNYMFVNRKHSKHRSYLGYGRRIIIPECNKCQLTKNNTNNRSSCMIEPMRNTIECAKFIVDVCVHYHGSYDGWCLNKDNPGALTRCGFDFSNCDCKNYRNHYG